MVLSWNQWFAEEGYYVYSQSPASSLLITGSTYVSSCVFINISESITLNTPTRLSLCVEDSAFSGCYNPTKDGGAIYFNEGDGCVLSRVCAFNCYTLSNGKGGVFFWIKVPNSLNNPILLDYTSVTHHLSTSSKMSYSSIFVYFGNISQNNLNSSLNKCNSVSSLRIVEAKKSILSFTNIMNNTAISDKCIEFVMGINSLSQCNIVRNHQLQTSSGTIYNWAGTANFIDCIFDQNTGSSYIIEVSWGSSSLVSCYLQTDIGSSGDITISKFRMDSQTLTLEHFHSEACTHHDLLVSNIALTKNNPDLSSMNLNIMVLVVFCMLSNI